LNNYKTFSDYDMLKLEISKSYSICVDTVTLISDFCASVYILSTSNKKYIFKLYRHFDTEIADQSINITCYLIENSFPVASIVNTKKECPNIVLSFPEGDRVGVLFDYIEGTIGYNLQFDLYASEMGELLSIMHNVMKTYCKPLLRYGKEHYIGRYINLMKEFNYTPSKIDELEEYGNILWDNVTKSKEGFRIPLMICLQFVVFLNLSHDLILLHSKIRMINSFYYDRVMTNTENLINMIFQHFIILLD